ncbi:hypothetical protein DH2020_002762 [Rehmannia glutinosa]|uniref:BHLH domain-containing protein n=1 Tax=Rehmannia glutinosa TaxID=99300 RepID=A0ABR0XUN3_REHGL
MSRNMNTLKHISSAEGDFLSSSREFMGGGSEYFPNQTPQQNQPSCSGLARYRSAPSSFLAALLDSTTDNNSSSGDDESEALFSALMSGPPLDLNQNMKQETGVESGARPGSQNGQMGYESAVNGGFGVMGEVGNYRVQNHAKANSSANGMSNHMNFSSPPSSSTRFMPPIPENGNQNIISTHNPENGQLRNGNNANTREFENVFSNDAWNDSPFNGLKRNRNGDLKMFSNFNGLDNSNVETRKNSSGLVHHLSLPKTSAEMAEVEKFLQFQPDAVPCQIRRTRISEKMKKLQDLFPNMDKQTSTADMLDLAVEYIKDLQKQVEERKYIVYVGSPNGQPSVLAFVPKFHLYVHILISSRLPPQ